VQQLLVTKLVKRDMRMYYKEICGTALVALQEVISTPPTCSHLLGEQSQSSPHDTQEGCRTSSSTGTLASRGSRKWVVPAVIEELLSGDPVPESDASNRHGSLGYVCRLPPGVEFWVLGAFETRPKGVHAPVVIYVDVCSAMHSWKCIKLHLERPVTSPPPISILARSVVPQLLFMSALSTLLCPPQVLRRCSTPSNAPATQINASTDGKGKGAPPATPLPFQGLLGTVAGGQSHHRSLFTWDALLRCLERLRTVLGTTSANSVHNTSLEVFLKEGVVECMTRRDNPLSACKNALVRTRSDFMVLPSPADGSHAGQADLDERSGLRLPDRYLGSSPPVSSPSPTSALSSSIPELSSSFGSNVLAERGGDPAMLRDVGCRVLTEYLRTCLCLDPSHPFIPGVFEWLRRETSHANNSASGGCESGGEVCAELDIALKYAVGHTLQQTGISGPTSSSSLLPLVVLVGYYSNAGPLETTTLLGARQQQQQQAASPPVAA
jgi:hypothetical protein